MPDTRLILTDLDGTLLVGAHNLVGDRTIRALWAAKAQGIKLAICTGRCLRIIPETALIPGLFDYIISSNGAVCTELATGKRLFTQYLSAEQAETCWNMLQAEHLIVEWFADGGILLEKRNYERWLELTPWNAHSVENGQATLIEDMHDFFCKGAPKLEKISAIFVGRDAINRLVPQLAALGKYNWLGATGDAVEITDIHATKGTALRLLCGSLGIDVRQSMAFGDSSNDVAMLTQAGIGVAMGNGSPEAFAAANDRTCSNADDGIGVYLEQHVLA